MSIGLNNASSRYNQKITSCLRTLPLLKKLLFVLMLQASLFSHTNALGSDIETPSQVAERLSILTLDFESTFPTLGVRARCSGCEHSGHGYVYTTDEQSFTGSHSLKLVAYKNRTEFSTIRFPTATDLQFNWSLYVPQELKLKGNATVSQLIGWQPNCHRGGNLHVRIKNGSWGVYLRNIGENSRDITDLHSVKPDSWTQISVNANFSYEHGYIEISFKDADKISKHTLVASGRTYVNCPKGPYFKAGLYGELAKDNTFIYIDSVSVYER